MKRPMMRLLGLSGGLAALLLLSSCGIKSGLQRPDPMWGADSARAADAARHDESAAARAERNARTGVNPETVPQIPEPGAPPLTSSSPVITPPPATPPAQ